MISATWKFADGSPFFELREHFQQGAVVGFLVVEAATDIIGAGWICTNLQKTKDVIRAQVRGARHRLGPRAGNSGRADFTHFFLGNAKLFSGEWGYIRRPTHDRLPALRQGSRTFPERGTWEAGRPGPPPLFFPDFNSQLSVDTHYG